MVGKAVDYALSFNPSALFNTFNQVILFDNITGIQPQINEIASYGFSVTEPVIFDDRFEIHFGALSLGENSTQTAASTYVHCNSIYILNAKGQA